MTIGSWLLAFNTTHYDDRRLCETQCSETSLGVYDFPQCAGLCDAAAQLPELHASPACQLPATTPTGGLPLLKPLLVFDGRPDLTWHAAARRQLLQEQREAAAGSAQPALPAGT